MTLFQYHLIGLALTSTSLVGFGIFLLLKNPERPLNRSMSLYCFSVAWWSGWEFFALQMPTRELAFLLMRIEYFGVAYIPTLFCTTASYLLNQSARTRKKVLIPLYVMSTLTLIPAVFFPTKQFLWVSSGPVFYLPIWGQAGMYYWMFMVFFFSAILTAHFLMIPPWLKASGTEKTRLTLFIFGSILAYMGGCPEFAMNYGVRIGWLNPFGLYAFPIYIGILTYAVVQHQFFDIHIVIRKSVVYSLLVTLLTAGYFGIVYFIEHAFQSTLGYHSIWISLAAFALMTLSFQSLKTIIQNAVDHLVFGVSQEELAKRMERLEAQAMQAEKFKAVSTLAAGMAHEIKNPLTILKTYNEFLPKKHADKQFIAEMHEALAAETSRMQQIIQDLLEFSKPKLSKQRPVHLEEIIHSTTNLFSAEFIKRKINCQTNCSLNGAAIQADPDQIRQILINLVQNALDAMPEGGSLSVSAETTPDNHVELKITDTGCGIPKELLPKIFDPFVTGKETGNGLGLTMVYSIVQAHRGTIQADSAPGQGTTFTLRFPL